MKPLIILQLTRLGAWGNGGAREKWNNLMHIFSATDTQTHYQFQVRLLYWISERVKRLISMDFFRLKVEQDGCINADEESILTIRKQWLRNVSEQHWGFLKATWSQNLVSVFPQGSSISCRSVSPSPLLRNCLTCRLWGKIAIYWRKPSRPERFSHCLACPCLAGK